MDADFQHLPPPLRRVRPEPRLSRTPVTPTPQETEDWDDENTVEYRNVSAQSKQSPPRSIAGQAVTEPLTRTDLVSFLKTYKDMETSEFSEVKANYKQSTNPFTKAYSFLSL